MAEDAGPYWDPYDFEIAADPHPAWLRLREEAPLYRNDRYDFWAVSRYADVKALSLDWKRFSSQYGTVLELINAPDVLAQVQSFLYMDPVMHDIHRSIVSRLFTPKQIGALEGRIRSLCSEFLDPLVAIDSFDFVSNFAARLPMMVIGHLLGVPESDQAMIRDLADKIVDREEGDTAGVDGAAAHADAIKDMNLYFKKLVAARREQPMDDLVSLLATAEIDDEGVRRLLTEFELLNFISIIAAAGNETVTNLLGWAIILLDQHPDQRASLVRDRSLLPQAVEELLRYEGPAAVQARVVMEDVKLYDHVVPAGARMILLNTSAGRDRRVYDDPDRFDIRRKVTHHMSFGYGVHFCLGAALARLQAIAGLDEILQRFPEWAVDHGHAKIKHTSTIRGWNLIPIHV